MREACAREEFIQRQAALLQKKSEPPKTKHPNLGLIKQNEPVEEAAALGEEFAKFEEWKVAEEAQISVEEKSFFEEDTKDISKPRTNVPTVSLIHILKQGQYRYIKQLIYADADIYAQNENGECALNIAQNIDAQNAPFGRAPLADTLHYWATIREIKKNQARDRQTEKSEQEGAEGTRRLRAPNIHDYDDIQINNLHPLMQLFLYRGTYGVLLPEGFYNGAGMAHLLKLALPNGTNLAHIIIDKTFQNSSALLWFSSRLYNIEEILWVFGM